MERNFLLMCCFYSWLIHYLSFTYYFPRMILPVIGAFPAQRASNAQNVSIWWRHVYQTNVRCYSFDFSVRSFGGQYRANSSYCPNESMWQVWKWGQTSERRYSHATKNLLLNRTQIYVERSRHIQLMWILLYHGLLINHMACYHVQFYSNLLF